MNSVTNSERIKQATTEVLLLNPEQKQALATIDSESTALGHVQGTTELVGVIAGIKPAALIRIEEIADPTLIEKVGLSYVLMDSDHFAVSRDMQLSLQLQDDFDNQRDLEGYLTDEGHRRIGKLLGYPETATDYFIDRSSTIHTDAELPMVLPKSLKGTTTDYFHQFILSPNNYQKEIDEHVKPLEIAVKTLTPLTYKMIEELTNREHRMENRRKSLTKKVGAHLGNLLGIKPKEPEETDIKYLHVD